MQSAPSSSQNKIDTSALRDVLAERFFDRTNKTLRSIPLSEIETIASIFQYPIVEIRDVMTARGFRLLGKQFIAVEASAHAWIQGQEQAPVQPKTQELKISRIEEERPKLGAGDAKIEKMERNGALERAAHRRRQTNRRMNEWMSDFLRDTRVMTGTAYGRDFIANFLSDGADFRTPEAKERAVNEFLSAYFVEVNEGVYSLDADKVNEIRFAQVFERATPAQMPPSGGAPSNPRSTRERSMQRGKAEKNLRRVCKEVIRAWQQWQREQGESAAPSDTAPTIIRQIAEKLDIHKWQIEDRAKFLKMITSAKKENLEDIITLVNELTQPPKPPPRVRGKVIHHIKKDKRPRSRTSVRVSGETISHMRTAILELIEGNENKRTLRTRLFSHGEIGTLLLTKKYPDITPELFETEYSIDPALQGAFDILLKEYFARTGKDTYRIRSLYTKLSKDEHNPISVRESTSEPPKKVPKNGVLPQASPRHTYESTSEYILGVVESSRDICQLILDEEGIHEGVYEAVLQTLDEIQTWYIEGPYALSVESFERYKTDLNKAMETLTLSTAQLIQYCELLQRWLKNDATINTGDDTLHIARWYARISDCITTLRNRNRGAIQKEEALHALKRELSKTTSTLQISRSRIREILGDIRHIELSDGYDRMFIQMVRTLTEPHILTSSSDIDSTYDAQVFHSTPYIMSPYHPLQSSEEIGTLSESHVLSIAQKNLDYVGHDILYTLSDARYVVVSDDAHGSMIHRGYPHHIDTILALAKSAWTIAKPSTQESTLHARMVRAVAQHAISHSGNIQVVVIFKQKAPLTFTITSEEVADQKTKK